MAKDKRKKDKAAAAIVCDKISGKQFEKELAALQVELTRLQTTKQIRTRRVGTPVTDSLDFRAGSKICLINPFQLILERLDPADEHAMNYG